jgi:hypothetical protein
MELGFYFLFLQEQIKDIIIGVLGRRFPGCQVVTKRSREFVECDPGVPVLH